MIKQIINDPQVKPFLALLLCLVIIHPKKVKKVKKKSALRWELAPTSHANFHL